MNNLISSGIHSVATANPSTNWVFSPASYVEAMYSLTLCADGANRNELAAALNLSPAQLEGEIALARRAFADIDSYNCLLFGKDYEGKFVQEVIDMVTRVSQGDVKSFSSPGEAIALVNSIVREKTRGKIDGLANEDNVDELTKLILLNCVYFKKEWLVEFDKPTYDEPFHNVDGSVTQIGLLKYQRRYHYYEDPLFDVVEIPYRNTNVCCYLFVPTQQGSVFSVLNNFRTNYARVAQVRSQLDCHLTVPPFKTETTLELNEAAQLGGVKQAFADSTQWKVIDWNLLPPGSYARVQHIAQKAFIDFTQKGTEAAAATMVSMLCISGCMMGSYEPPPIKYIRADKPFVYCLANRENPSIPLFVGVVNKL